MNQARIAWFWRHLGSSTDYWSFFIIKHFRFWSPWWPSDACITVTERKTYLRTVDIVVKSSLWFWSFLLWDNWRREIIIFPSLSSTFNCLSIRHLITKFFSRKLELHKTKENHHVGESGCWVGLSTNLFNHFQSLSYFRPSWRRFQFGEFVVLFSCFNTLYRKRGIVTDAPKWALQI